MAAAPRAVRIDGGTWTTSADRINALTAPLRVTVTLRPGDTRNGAIEAFLRAILDATEPRTRRNPAATTNPRGGATMSTYEIRTAEGYDAVDENGGTAEGYDAQYVVPRRAEPLPRPEGVAQVAPNGREFPWGPIVQVHAVGDVEVVEYLEDRSGFRADRQDGHGRTLYHPYIADEDAMESYTSLDSALVGAIACKRSGPNDGRYAARHFDLVTLGSIPEEGQ